MHARIVRYTYTGDATALARQAEDGLLPILQSQPGFKAYSVIESDGEIISFSAWESAENAESANDAAASWVAENMAGIIELKQAWIGEILISTLLGVSTASIIMLLVAACTEGSSKGPTTSWLNVWTGKFDETMSWRAQSLEK